MVLRGMVLVGQRVAGGPLPLCAGAITGLLEQAREAPMGHKGRRFVSLRVAGEIALEHLGGLLGIALAADKDTRAIVERDAGGGVVPGSDDAAVDGRIQLRPLLAAIVKRGQDAPLE